MPATIEVEGVLPDATTINATEIEPEDEVTVMTVTRLPARRGIRIYRH